MDDARPPVVRATTHPVQGAEAPLGYADAHDPLVWRRGNTMLVGVGEALRLTFDGPNRLRDAAEAWQLLLQRAVVDDSVNVPGTGVVAFGSFAFAEDSAQSSVLRIPRWVVGHRDGQSFLTEIRLGDDARAEQPQPTPIVDGARTRWEPARDAREHQAAVRGALSYIQAGSVQKVVLARAIFGEIAVDTDLRSAVQRLSDQYPDTWVFAIDGLIGASPETLVAVRSGEATVRVLAGTLDRANGSVDDLLTSAKNQNEHRFAVENVTESLRSAGLTPTERLEPFALELPDLWHLASDVSFATGGTNVLRLVDALHPTAAVAGTPTDAALKVIGAFELIDRGRYAGPVGWLDGAGNGEWAIALRCAQVTGTRVRACAGGGIVAGSDPALEYAETELKLRAIRSAL